MHHLNGFLGTICSTGSVSLWSTTISDKKLTLICSTIDESIRPTCIKLIDTTKNRYESAVTTVDTKEIVLCSAKKTRPISTTGKIIVEMDSSENGAISSTNENWRLQISDDDNTDVEVVRSPEKKKLKKAKKVSSNDVKSTVTSIYKSKTTPSKKKAATVTPMKPIIVRSLNSDDDFESDDKRSTKKKTITSQDVVKTKRPATRTGTPRKSNTQVQLRNRSTFNDTTGQKKSASTSIHDSTPILKNKAKTQETPTSNPTGIQQTKLSQSANRKSDLSKTGPATQMVTTRNMRRMSTI